MEDNVIEYKFNSYNFNSYVLVVVVLDFIKQNFMN